MPGAHARVLRARVDGESDTPEITVRVQDADSREPLIGASLTVDSHQGHDGEATTATDGNGVAVVRVQCLDAAYPILTARYGPLFGELWSDAKPTAGVYTVYLRPDTAVVVRVSHIDGSPAPDSAVELLVRTWPLEKPSLESVTVLKQRTDTRGVATFAHVTARAHRYSTGVELGADFTAVLPGLGVSSEPLSLDREEMQVCLIRPATSSATLQIKCRNPDDLLGAVCRVRPVDATGVDRPAAEVPLQPDGTVLPDLLPGVLHGVELLHWDRVLGRVEFAAPHPGSSTEVALHLDNWEVISASLVDADGAVVNNQHVKLSMRLGAEISECYGKTDDVGRVAISVDATSSKGSTCTWVIVAKWPSPRSGMRSAPFALGDANEMVDGFPLSIVSHEGMRVVAQGRVMDDRGRALGPSMMRALRSDGVPGVLDVSFVPISGEAEPGEFYALGDIVDAALVIQASGPGWTEEVTCSNGATNVRIVHVRDCSLTAFIEGDAAASLRVVLRKCIDQGGSAILDAGSEDVRGGLSVPTAGPGTRLRREPGIVRRLKGGYEFFWQSLDEGVYDLEAHVLGGRDAYLLVPAIVVEPGECSDPRLRSCSLGSAARVVSLLFQQPDDRSRTGSCPLVARVAAPPAEGVLDSVSVLARNSRVSLFVDKEAGDVAIVVDGFQPVVVPQSATDLAIDLVRQ